MSDEKSPVQIDVSAGVNLKAEITTEIPSDSSGRLLDALTDIIRPFSEKRGLRADLIRLQREQVAVEIARIARARIEAEGREPESIPNRVLVPLLERSSLVEIEDRVLISAWAEILSNASGSDDPNLPVFVDTLGKLSAAHLNVLVLMYNNNEAYKFGDCSIDFRESFIKFKISKIEKEVFINKKIKDEHIKRFGEKIDDHMCVSGVSVLGGSISCDPDIKKEMYFEFETQYLLTPDMNESIFGALCALNLLERVYLEGKLEFDWGNIDYWVDYVVFTDFGVGFFDACNPEIERE